MRVAVDISLYPLDTDFILPIESVIDRLNTYDSIDVVTNPMATQLRGQYGEVMDALKREIGTTFEQIPKAVFAIKILNNPITG
jgi:uncharacterized protein YqgV (UPF0045/DUF77 family)